ncbi:MAG: glutamate synthase [Rubrivivax sp. SCN 71-131]|jgi:glutamate synthase (NADPH/NADH) small chain|nr:MAG: glutamate synthase [Rubrivivax sp. SCN 71-131]
MGKITGFLEYERQEETYEPVALRLQNWREFVHGLDAAQARIQGARCMDCGTPFCNHGCPVNNLIPDFNDLVYRDDWKRAIEVLHRTNNFPEFTGRVCPAPCEAACTLNFNSVAVGIKSIEHAIIDRAWAEGWVRPQPAARASGKTVAIVGSGPAGLAAAQQLARAGHAVTVFEKNARAGGLLRYGIPDFKLEKRHIERRVEQMQAEGVVFRTGVRIASLPADARIHDESTQTLAAEDLLSSFDAVLLAGGAERSRDLPLPGRELSGVHFAMEFLVQQNGALADDKAKARLSAAGKHVIVIGGGDTGSDCVGTSNRQGAASVTQFELMPLPPEHEDKALTWPYWPYKLRTSSSHEEGCMREFAIATQAFVAGSGKARGQVAGLDTVQVQWEGARMVERPDSARRWKADLVLLAMGFVAPAAELLEAFGVERDARGNARAATDAVHGYRTSAAKVFAAGDMRRGQSLVVWAIREGRQAARAIDEFLMGHSVLPR